MRRVFEDYSLEIISVFMILALVKTILFGYNILGFYDFNDLFLK